ncbi:MAG TPA: MFS transporter [Burkholderiales bacterium]|nr:MFS transporter [Burkholderiales bacterium]
MNRRPMLLLLVLSGVIISIAMGLRQSLGIFMRPMTAELGISAATFGFSIALQNIVYGVAQPLVGAIADKRGARPVVIACGVFYAGGLALMAFAGAFTGAIEVAGFLTGIGTSGTALGVLIGAVTRAAPPERRTQTVGLVAAMGSLGTMVLAPLGQWMINSFGWHAAMLGYTAIAASMILLCLPIQDHRGPEKARAQGVGDALREALGHRGYVFMTLAFFACGFQLVFITTHLASYLQFCGVPPGVSATALGLIGLCNAIGTYIFGHLGARYSQKHLLALIYLARTTIIIIFLAAPISAASTLVFAAAMGFLWLGVAPLITGVLGRVFGLQHFNMLYGVVFLSHQLGSFFGAWMGGVVFDRFGNYNVAWGALIAIGVTAFTLQWLMDERPPRKHPGAPAAVPA